MGTIPDILMTQYRLTFGAAMILPVHAADDLAVPTEVR